MGNALCSFIKSTVRSVTSLQLVLDVSVVIGVGAARAALVHLGGDGVSDVGQLLLLLLKVLGGGLGAVLLEPLGSLLDSVKDL